jgi:beta-lactamase regulating signal transducer with metallopeptidase domain
MNTLAHLYPGADAVRLAASIAVQIAGIVLLSLFASSTLARRNAALRDGIWKAALTLVCIAPFSAWAFQHAGIALRHTPARVVEPRSRIRENSKAPTQATTVLTQTPLPAAQPRAPTRSVSANAPATPTGFSRLPLQAAPSIFETVVGAITAIWAAGAAFLLARLVAGLRVIARLRRDLAPFSDLPASVAERLRRTLGLATLPEVMLSQRIGGPASVGLLRPVVVLPADLAAKMNPEELHDALAHECAHAQRRDARVALVQQILAALYWLHPLVHMLNRQMARAREEVCDNIVLAGTTATDYARTLLSLSQTVQSIRGRIAVVPMFDPRWHLAPRVAGLLNTRRILMNRMNRGFKLLLAVAALAVGAAFAAIGTASDSSQAATTKTAPDSAPPTAPSSAKTPVENTPRGESPPAHVFAGLAVQLAEADDRLRKALVEPRFDERKAELDVKEAAAVLEATKLRHQQLVEANRKVPGAIDHNEVERAEVDVRVAAIKLDKARLAWERAQATVERELPRAYVAYSPDTWIRSFSLHRVPGRATRDSSAPTVGRAPSAPETARDASAPTRPEDTSDNSVLTPVGGTRQVTDHVDPDVADGITVKFALNVFVHLLPAQWKQSVGREQLQNFEAPRDLGPVRVAVVRFEGSLRKTLESADELKPTDGVLLRDLVEGKAKNETVHRGDFIVLFGGRLWKEEPASTETTVPSSK